MTITSLAFVVFCLAAALAVRLASAVAGPALRSVVMLACNLWFFASMAGGSPEQWLKLLPMVGFMALGLAVIQALQRPWGKPAFAVLVALVMACFFWLKKYAFVPPSLWLPGPYVQLGLSYILFRVLQVAIDARDGNLPQRLKLVDYLNYLLNFPTFISGPIQRYQDWAAQQQQPVRLDWAGFGQAVERMALGAFKVLVVAPIFLGWHKGALQQVLSTTATATAWEQGLQGALVAGGYAVYLYFNFSGYTDIVLGVGRFLGMALPENFRRPFAAASFLDFWARWHMSLSEWLKTYVYSPVVKALMQRFRSRGAEPYIGVFAFFVTFFLIGLWHGQTAVFALYGFLLGLGVSGNKLWQIAMAKRLGKKRYVQVGKTWPYQAAGRGLTFTWFSLSLVCFWAQWGQITGLVASLGTGGIAVAVAVLFVAAAVIFTAEDSLRTWALRWQAGGAPLLAHRYLRTVVVTTMVLVAVVSTALTAGPAPDIVYKNF